MKKTIAIVIMLIIMLITLTGCMTVDYELKINTDGSADISYVFGYSRSFFKSMGVTDAELEESFNQEGFSDMENEVAEKGYKVEKVSNEEIFGFKATKHLNTVEEYDMKETFADYMKDSESKFNVTKGLFANKYSISTSVDLTDLSMNTSEDSSDDSMAVYANMFINQMKMNYKVNLPSKAVSNNATSISEDGKVLTWELKPGQVNEIKLEYEQINLMTFIIGGAIILAIIVIVVLIIVFKGKKGKTLNVEKEFSE